MSLSQALQRGYALVGAALLAACGNSHIEWKEEVKLQSGEVIVVKRSAQARSLGEVGGPGGWENEGMTLTIAHPKRSDNPPAWEGRFVPLLFDREATSGEWFLVATFYSCQSWYDLGRPALPYTEYRLRNGRWVQGPLSASLIGRDANMFTSVRSDKQSDVSLAGKEADLSDPRIGDKFKRIVPNWKTGC
jgi:hypothetical protein